MVAVRLSRIPEARMRKWRILVQVARAVWEEIPSARVGVFKSPGLLRNSPDEIQLACLETNLLTPAVYRTLAIFILGNKPQIGCPFLQLGPNLDRRRKKKEGVRWVEVSVAVWLVGLQEYEKRMVVQRCFRIRSVFG